MAKKRRPQDETPNAAPRAAASGGNPAAFLAGSKAKWLFFGIYLVLTFFLFRDFLFSDFMLYGNDTNPDGVYTRQYYKNYHHEYGGVPRWNPLILGGLPFIDAMHGDTFYPGAWIQFLMPLHRALGHKLIWHVFLAGVFMYLFLRTLRMRRDAAFLGGLMYMLAPSFVSLVYPAHDAKMYVTAFLPLAFALLETLMETPRVWKAALLGGVMGLLILTSHVQMAYYSYWALGLWFLYRLFTVRGNGGMALSLRSALFVVSVALALGLGLVQLLPSYKFTTAQSVRSGVARTSYEYATSWSMHPEEVAGMIVPSFQGFQKGIGFEDNYYWGRNPFKLNSEYNGILPILFAILAVAMYRSGRTWFFLGLGALALVYALGADTPLYHLFYSFVPGVKNFRAPGMIVFLFAFAACTMASGFLSSFLDEPAGTKKQNCMRLLYAAGAVIACALFVTIVAKPLFDLWKSVLYPSIPQDRYDNLVKNIPAFTRDLWRVAIIAAAALAGLWMYRTRRIGSAALAGLLALAVVVDSTVVDARYIATIDPATYPVLAQDASVAELKEKLKTDPDARALTMLSSHAPNYYAMFGIRSANGAHNNELKSYEAFRGQNGLNFLEGWVDLNAGRIDPEGIGRNNFLKVAGVKYILIPAGEGNIHIAENTAALGRAFVVHEYVVAADTAAAAALRDPAFDAAKTAVLDADPDPKPSIPSDSTAVSTVRKVNARPRSFEIEASLATPGIVVLSENMVPYWSATVDGKPTKIFRAYGTFMAVAATAGDHKIVFSFRSGPFETGKRASLISLALMFAMAAPGIVIAFRTRKAS